MSLRDRCFRNSTFLLPVVLVVATAAAAAPLAEGPQQAVELMRRGIAKIQEGDIEGGLRDLQEAIEVDPEQPQAHFYAGQASAQLERWEQAYDYFVAAADLAPGYGEAHVQACRVAYTLERFDESWQHAILAAQAGIDMEGAFEGLAARSPEPEDLRRRLEAPRVFIGGIDTEALAAQDALPDATGIPTGGPAFLAEMQAELAEIRRQFGVQLQQSPSFGVVPRPDIATYVLSIKADAVENGRSLRGFVKLIDPASDEEVYSRVLTLDNIRSGADLRNDIGRYVGYMERWLEETGRKIELR